MTVAPFVLAAAQLLAPGRDHTVLADAIAARVDAELPLFADDTDRRRTAALLVAVAWRESSLRLDAVGDQGRSVCAFQILGGARSLLTDADACVGTGMRMLRASLATCRHVRVEARLAGYARGNCTSAEGQRLSRDRFALAQRLARTVVITPPIGAFYLLKTTAHPRIATAPRDREPAATHLFALVRRTGSDS